MIFLYDYDIQFPPLSKHYMQISLEANWSRDHTCHIQQHVLAKKTMRANLREFSKFICVFDQICWNCDL